MVLVLFRDMCHPDPQYSAPIVRKVKCTCLGCGTRLSRLHTLDHPLALAFLGSIRSTTPDLEQENNQGIPDKLQIPQADSLATGLHNSD
jgi:hypothetical protein